MILFKIFILYTMLSFAILFQFKAYQTWKLTNTEILSNETKAWLKTEKRTLDELFFIAYSQVVYILFFNKKKFYMNKKCFIHIAQITMKYVCVINGLGSRI